jgi:hypothetical protein
MSIDSATRFEDMYPPRTTLNPILPVVACMAGCKPMSFMCVCAKSSRLPEMATLNLRGMLLNTGFPRSPVSAFKLNIEGQISASIQRIDTLFFLGVR